MDAVTDWVIIESCPFCGAKELRPYRTVASAPALLIQFCNGTLPVLASCEYKTCAGCGLVMQSPRMSEERLAHYYASGLYRDTLGLSVEAMDADERRRSNDVAAWLLAQGVMPKSHGDIGSSRGYLLDAMGAAVRHGYDANPNYSPGLVGRDDLQACELITSVHVLEHVADPVIELAWYRSLTTRYLLLEVPGEKCQGGPLRFAHLFYFPPRLLVDMVEAQGFRVLRVDTEPNTRILAEAD